MKQDIMNLFTHFWQQRDARERRMLGATAGVVLAALIYALFLDPALSNRTALEKTIPVLRQQVAEMALMSGQYAKIATQMKEDIAPVTREVIEASLLRRGIKAQTLSASDEVVRLQVTSVAYSNMMEWLLEMQKVARLTVDDAKVTALVEKGQVSVVLTLRQQKGSS
jgi:general secretion pathway protein M